MVDYRLEWLKERVLVLLEEADDSIFTDLLVRDESQVRKQLVEFFGADVGQLDNKNKKIVFFYKTFQRKLIEPRDASVAQGNQQLGAEGYGAKDASSDDDGHDSSGHSSSKSPPLSRTPLLSGGKSSKGSAKKSRGSIHRASVSSDTKSAKKSISGSAKAAKKGRKSPSTVVESLTDDFEDNVENDSSLDTGGESSPEPPVEKKLEVEIKPVLHCKFGALCDDDYEKVEDRQVALFARIEKNGLRGVDSWEKATELMPKHYLVGAYAGEPLDAFSNLLQNVMTPLFFPGTRESFVELKRRSSLDMAMTLRMAQSIPFSASQAETQKPDNSDVSEVFQNIKNLTENLLQYQKSLVKFHLEESECEAVKKILAGDDAIQHKDTFDAILARWTPQVQGHLDDILKKNPCGESPMAEVEFWEETEISLSALNCSLQKSSVIQISLICKKIELERAANFHAATQRVETLLIEAREITRSFAPLINFFQELSACDCLTTANEILAKLMDGLRLLWVLCSPYNRDERMEGILARVAWQLCTKVSDLLNMDTFFKKEAELAKKKSKEATKLLKSWKELYFQTRRAIEKAGHTARWEFDVRKLFGHSEYIREVCVDLTEICEVLIHFRSVLNLDLKSIIRSQTMVDVLLKQVALLIAPIQQDADFEVFVAVNADSWRSFMNHFRRNVLVLEQEICDFLNESISRGNLSSAEDAVKKLQIFHAADTRAAIKLVIDSKFEVVIRELLEEIQETKRTFLNNKDVPPLLKNQPRDAGAIYWSRSLFNRLKNSIVCFKKCKDLQESELLKEAFGQYVQLVRQMKVYQDEHFENWTKKTERIISNVMSSHLIRVVKKREEKQQSTTAVERRLGSLFASSDGGGQSASEASSRMMLRPVLASLRWVARAVAARKRASEASESALVLPHIGLDASDASVPSLGLQYEVGFSDDLFLVLLEAEMMEQLGLSVKTRIKNVAIQRAHLEASVRNLRASVRKLNEMLAPLDVAEVALLQFALKRLEAVIEPGIYRLKWTSQSVSDFCEEMDEAVDTFGASVQIFKLCASKAQQQTENIQSFNLFYVKGQDKVLPWQIFFEQAGESRKASVQEMVQAYQSLSKILVDLEFLLDKTHTGRKDCMQKYYLHWEQLFFEALLNAIVGSLDHFSKILSGDKVLLEIDALLENSHSTLCPTPVDAFSALMSSTKEVVLSAKQFRRWMDGTCVWCPDADDGEPKPGHPTATREFTFLEDVAKIERVRERHAALKCIAEDLLVKVQREHVKWEKYSLLWKNDKAKSCEVFAAKNSSVGECDEKLAYFSRIEAEMESAAPHVDVGCVRINVAPLIAKIKAHAAEWKWHLAQGVLLSSKKEMKTYLWSMWALEADVDQVVYDDDDLDTLKEVLEAVVKIRDNNTDREVQAYFIGENFRTMNAHNIKVEDRDALMSVRLWPMWQELYELSKRKRKQLAPMHEKFSALTTAAAADFQRRCDELRERFDAAGPGSVGADLGQGLLLLDQFNHELKEMEREKILLSADEMLFDVHLSDHSTLSTIQSQMLFLQEVFDLYAQLKSAKDKWSSTLWVDLSAGSLSAGIKHFDEMFDLLSPEAKGQAVATQLKDQIDDFKNSVPLFEALKCDALRPRHWHRLMESTGSQFSVAAESLRLQNLFEMQLHQHENSTFLILTQAEEELKIEQQLYSVQKTWQLQDFNVEKFEVDGIDHGSILGCFQDTLDHLNTHQNLLKTLLNSKFVGPFLDTVHAWEQKLSVIEECVQLWTRIRDKWINLEVLFSNKEVHVHLPSASVKRFDSCRQMHHKLIKEIAKNPQILAVCCRPGTIGHLRNVLLLLEQSQKAFDNYLFSKRQIFPRLYFVGDDELIRILAGQTPLFLHQIFAQRLLFPSIAQISERQNEDGDGYLISGFHSLENEFIAFKKPLKTEDTEKVNLLCQLSDKIKSAVAFKISESMQSLLDGDIPLDEYVVQCPANLSSTGLHVLWTRSVEERLQKVQNDTKAMRNYLDEIDEDLNKLISPKKKLQTGLEKAKLTAAFVLLCHFKAVVEKLISAGVSDKAEFLWDSQLRFYWTDDKLTVQQAFSELDYGNEFNGMESKLICTPETERVRLIITQALRLQVGVLVEGSAGAGKSAVVRDLALTLGRRLVSFDCGAGTPWRSVARVLSGVAQSGFWGCLKHFHLLRPSTLSLVSAQLHTLKAALAMRLASFNFNDTEVRLDASMAIFATVRPRQDGATELPLSLTALFRPAAATPPNLYLVCAVQLQALGFNNYKKLASKVTKFCELCADKLSKERHYDFGLSQMNSVFNILGRVFHPNDGADEQSVLFAAVKNSICYKLHADDKIMFAELIKDVFPRIDEIGCPGDSENINACLQQNGYQLLQQQTERIRYLKQILENKNAALVLGKSGAGKSVVVEVCLQLMKQKHRSLNIVHLSPKSCGREEFFGRVEERDFQNGLFSKIFREVCADKKRVVFVFDSQIDPIWVENLSSVLDKNRCLTLCNADRIFFDPELVSFVFESGSLRNAAPSILPRAAVIYLDSNKENYEALWKSTREQRFSAISDDLEKLFSDFVPPLFDLIRESGLKTITPFWEVNAVDQLADMLQILLTSATCVKETFIHALYLSIGATLLEQEQGAFDAKIKQLAEMEMVSDDVDCPAKIGQLPQSKLFDYIWDGEKACWLKWNWMSQPDSGTKLSAFEETMIPTPMTTFYHWLMTKYVEGNFQEMVFKKIKRPLVLVGEEGCSKTMMVKSFMGALDSNKYSRQCFSLSLQTNANDIRAIIKGAMQNRTRNIMEPPDNKKLIIFLDDLNMPLSDAHGTQETTEFLRFLLQQGGFYEGNTDFNWLQLEHIGFTASITADEFSQSKLDQRLLAKLNLVHIPKLSDSLLHCIYSKILVEHLQNFAGEVQQLTDNLVSASLHLFKILHQSLPPTPARWMCQLGVRDLTRMFSGLCQTQPQNFSKPETLVRVWIHEIYRVFADRLESDEDQLMIENLVRESIKEYFEPYLEHTLRNPVLFGDFRNALTHNSDQRYYEDLLDFEAVFFLFQEVLEELNKKQEGPKIEVVLFDSALEHLSRLHRVLRMRKGHSVLVGSPGCGRKSLFSLAACAAQCMTFRLPFAPKLVHNLVKQIYRFIGVQKKAAALYVIDADFKQQGVSEILYHMMTTGWVPGLFNNEEKIEILEELRKEDGSGEEQNDKLWTNFQNACVSRLHVVMSLARETLYALTQEYPEFLTFTMLDWYRPWNENALRKVGKHFVVNNNLIHDNEKDVVLSHIIQTHVAAHEMYQNSHINNINCSPRLYTNFIQLTMELLQKNKEENEKSSDKLKIALSKIEAAKLSIQKLKDVLAEKVEYLATSRTALEKITEEISQVRETKDKEVEISMEWDRGIERQVRILSSDRIQVQRILDCALPDLNAAKESFQNIQKADLQSIRAWITEPVEGFRAICESVLMLKGEDLPDTEKLITTFESSSRVKKLAEIDCENISHTVCRKVKVKVKRGGKLDELYELCPITKTFMALIDSVLQYCNVLREVKPKLELISHVELELIESRKKSTTFQEEIKCVEEKLNILEEQKVKIEEQVEGAENAKAEIKSHLEKMEELFSRLQSDEDSLLADVSSLDKKRTKLLGDCLLVAAFVSYGGPLGPLGERHRLVDTWRRSLHSHNIPFSSAFHPHHILAASTLIEKCEEFCENDDVTMQNILLIFKSVRAPLCIDPQQQAASWIKSIEKELVLASAFDFDLVEKIEAAAVVGNPVLLQDLTRSISSALFDILDRVIIAKEEGNLVKIGDNLVPLHPNFKIYFNTREAKPNLEAVVFSKTTVIDCTMTAQALEELLIKDVIKAKDPAHYQQRQCLRVQEAQVQRSLRRLREELIESLVQAPEEHLLRNQPFLSAIRRTKDLIHTAAEEEAAIKSQTAAFGQVQNEFSEVAQRAATLFSVLADLAHMGPTYLFSLTTFRELMATSIAEVAEKGADDDSNFADAVCKTLTLNVHSFTCRSLFAEHQLPFTLAMILRIQLSKGQVSPEEAKYLTCRGEEVDAQVSAKESPRWIDKTAYRAVADLQNKFPHLFANLCEDIRDQSWQQWSKFAVPEKHSLPMDYSKKLTAFQVLLVVKALRRDRVIPAILNYICDNFGQHFITPIIPSMRSLLNESSSKVPILFTVSGGGVDPSTELQRLSKQMGLDQASSSPWLLARVPRSAMAALQTAVRRGQWLLLLNCHLVANLPALVWCYLDQSRPHPDFRLWVTTDRTATLPPILLHNALKVVLETPKGLKLKLNSTFRKIDPDVMSKNKHSDFGKILYALAHFHATIQERGEFARVGWNNKYHFTKPDFDACAFFLDKYLVRVRDSRRIPWDAIQNFMQQVIYGAHMVDDFDSRVIDAYLHEFCGAFIFNTKFYFYQDACISYGLPSIQNLFGILAYIQNLPLNYSPVVLGLHSNADVVHNKNCLLDLMDNLIKLQPQPILVQNDLAVEAAMLEAVEKIKVLIPEDLDPVEVKKVKFKSAVQHFILQEVNDFNKLLLVIRQTLASLENALKGKGKLTKEIKLLQEAIMKDEVPQIWKNISPPTNKKLASWLRHLQKRFRQYYDWVMRYEPLVAWLPGLSNPRSYLLTVLQTACRKYHWSIEEAGLVAEITSAKFLPALNDGIYVKGIYLENGGWDSERQCLKEAEVCSLSEALPVIQITAAKNAPQQLGNRVRLPLYFTLANTQHVVWELDLACPHHPSTWLLQGARLVLNPE